MLVVENSLAVEFLAYPHAIVGWLVFGVVKNASAIDFVVFELSLVESAVSKEQFPPAILLAIQVLSLIVSAFLIFSLEILYLLQAVPHFPHLHLVLLLDERLLAALELLELLLKPEVLHLLALKRGLVGVDFLEGLL